MTTGEHLAALRRVLFRVLGVTLAFAIGIYLLKDETFSLLLAPGDSDFVTYRLIESACQYFGSSFRLETFRLHLISTELSSQFMIHLSTSFWLALLCASPYVVLELFRFISPALYNAERRMVLLFVPIVYVLFVLGILMSYFVLFPVSVRFLGTYQVAASVENQITLSSYVSTFSTLTFLMGLAFQLPVLSFVLARLGMLRASLMRNYRRHALLLIVIIAAVITPPDLLSLVLVAFPLYLLYEVSIWVVRCGQKQGEDFHTDDMEDAEELQEKV